MHHIASTDRPGTNIFKKLYELGANLETLNHEGKTPLFYCTNSLIKLKTITTLGANVHAIDFEGNTIMHIFARGCKDGMIRHLNDLGSPTNLENFNNKIPYDIAIERDQMTIARWLKKNKK